MIKFSESSIDGQWVHQNIRADGKLIGWVSTTRGGVLKEVFSCVIPDASITPELNTRPSEDVGYSIAMFPDLKTMTAFLNI